jgi:predicted enzyme related to lactoylglutathione lyase
MHQSLPNTIDYIEMPSRDLAKTKKFFSSVFGWSFVDYGPDYASFDDGRMAGGFFASEKTAGVGAGAPLVVFYHGELEKMKAKIVDLDGEITRDIFEFPGGRRFHFREPGGGEFAIWVGQIDIVDLGRCRCCATVAHSGVTDYHC